MYSFIDNTPFFINRNFILRWIKMRSRALPTSEKVVSLEIWGRTVKDIDERSHSNNKLILRVMVVEGSLLFHIFQECIAMEDHCEEIGNYKSNKESR